MRMTTLMVRVLTLLVGGSRVANADPESAYLIEGDAGKHLFVTIPGGKSQEKYFIDLVPGTIYRFESKLVPFADSEANRAQIIKKVKSAYVNQAAQIDLNKMTKFKKAGWCIPSILSNGDEGACFAIDFQTDKKGFISGFVIGNSLPCSKIKSGEVK